MKYLYFFLTILSLEGTFAQDSTLIELEKITVTANIITTDLRATGRNLSIISQKTIEASPVKTIEGI
jgi:hypothetical protein